MALLEEDLTVLFITLALFQQLRRMESQRSFLREAARSSLICSPEGLVFTLPPSIGGTEPRVVLKGASRSFGHEPGNTSRRIFKPSLMACQTSLLII
jgi:hypothetical protein